MRNLKFAILATAVLVAGVLAPEAAFGGDRTDVWVAEGGRAGYRYEGERTWREYAADGTLLAELEEQDRGPSYVLLYVEGRDIYLRLESGRSLTRPKNGGTFVKYRDGDWSARTPAAWPRSVPKEVVTDIWLFRGGGAGYRYEGERTWREYAADGTLLAELEEQDRGPSHVLLYVEGRDVYLRLEAGRSLTKPKNGGTFVKYRDGDWSRRAPRAWPKPVPKDVVTEQWLSGNGREGFRRHGDGQWWEYAADGRPLARYRELERSASHVLLHDPVGGSYVRLESGRCLVRQRNGRDFAPRWTGKWGHSPPTHWQPPQPEQPQAVLTDVWLVAGGLSGFRRERDGTWREYSAGGKAVNFLTEQERGGSYVLLHNAERDSYVRLESDRCYTRFRGARDFVLQWNGGWARRTPSHWQTPEPQQQVVVTSVWLMQGGRAGFMREGGQTWTEYGQDGRPLNTYVEQERGAAHVVLHDASRGVYLRLEPGNCLVKLRGQRAFSPQWYGNWATGVPSHWQLPTRLPEIWLLTGGGGYRREGSPPVWVAYGPDGRAGLRFVEERRTAGYVQILEPIQGLRMRLLAGELQVPDATGKFVRLATGGWSGRAPANWPALPGNR